MTAPTSGGMVARIDGESEQVSPELRWMLQAFAEA
jgi:hypothetical protein